MKFVMFKRVTCRTLRVSVVVHVDPVAHGGVVAAPQQRPHHSRPVPAEGNNDSSNIVKTFAKIVWQLYIPVVVPPKGEHVDALHVEHHRVVQVGSLGPQHRALQCKQIFSGDNQIFFGGQLEYLANLQQGGGQQVRERGLRHVVLHLPAAAQKMQRINKCYLVRTW